ncbi:hypothetical protein HDG37_007001 [Paraburkholderia sp. MM5384-R2]|nr:hypothetical protein [Paraburkholderia sp. MM5384-R2]
MKLQELGVLESPSKTLCRPEIRREAAEMAKSRKWIARSNVAARRVRQADQVGLAEETRLTVTELPSPAPTTKRLPNKASASPKWHVRGGE